MITRNCIRSPAVLSSYIMGELGNTWTRDLEESIRRVKAAGRFEVADYLSLKASNDAVRTRSVKWLFDTVTAIVEAFNGHGAGIEIKSADKHLFRLGKSHLRGTILELRKGLRCLTIEAGWTRLPRDGFMRGGALACARISHFGFPKNEERLELLRFENAPYWFSVEDKKQRVSFTAQSLKKHFEVFLG